MTLREALQGAEDVVFTDGAWEWPGDEWLRVLAVRAPRLLDHPCEVDADGIVFARDDGSRAILRPRVITLFSSTSDWSGASRRLPTMSERLRDAQARSLRGDDVTVV
jgi:hypothetical protein